MTVKTGPVMPALTVCWRDREENTWLYQIDLKVPISVPAQTNSVVVTVGGVRRRREAL